MPRSLNADLQVSRGLWKTRHFLGRNESLTSLFTFAFFLLLLPADVLFLSFCNSKAGVNSRSLNPVSFDTHPSSLFLLILLFAAGLALLSICDSFHIDYARYCAGTSFILAFLSSATLLEVFTLETGTYSKVDSNFSDLAQKSLSKIIPFFPQTTSTPESESEEYFAILTRFLLAHFLIAVSHLGIGTVGALLYRDHQNYILQCFLLEHGGRDVVSELERSTGSLISELSD